MKATQFLKAQHREVETLFERIEKAEGKGRELRALFTELAEKIDAHAKIEERIFYPVAKEFDKDMTLESYEEHDAVRSLIKKIRKVSTGDETFTAKVTVLKEMIEHHVQEEEGEMFPKCEKKLDEGQIEELGDELEAAYRKLIPPGRKSQEKQAA